MRNTVKIELWLLLLLTFAPLIRAAAPDEARLARGKQIYAIGGCGNCHTAEGGAELAGGDPLKTPFGTFYPPNITPDRATGIGAWTAADFRRALREGVSPTGMPYYPAFPFTSYTRMTDEEIQALKTYLDTVTPVNRSSRDHDLQFPYNLLSGLWIWRRLFFQPGPFRPDPFRSQRWNRGAYLVEGPGHCGECHTPRNWLGAPDRSRRYGGAVLGEIKAPNITPDPDHGIGAWSDSDLLYFFQTGVKPDGDTVSGEMAKVVRNGTSHLPEADLRAIIEYLRSLPAVPSAP